MMTNSKSTKIKSFLAYTLLAIVAGIIYWASANILWLGDDFYYQYIFGPISVPSAYEHLTGIESFSDVIYSQCNHYYTYNGRFVAHVLVQIFCGLWGQQAFAIFNAVAFVLLIVCVAYVVGQTRQPGTLLSSLILVLLVFVTKMTPSAQINYVWVAILDLLFIKVFLSNKRYSPIKIFFISILSLLAGNGNEAFSIGISGAIIIYWIVNFRNFRLQDYIFAICYGVGALLLCLSPGSLNRAGATRIDVMQSLFFFIFSLRAVYILMILVAYKICIKKVSIIGIYKEYAFYWNVLFISIVFNLIVGVFCNRQLFGAELMAILIILDLLKNHKFNGIWMCILSAMAVYCVYIEIEKTLSYIKQKESIFSKFEDSADGVVYQDTWLPLSEGWSSYFWENGYHSDSFKKLMRREYPDKPELAILPEYFEGKIDQNLPNSVHHYADNSGTIIFVQNKKNPATFVVERKFFGILPYQHREMDFSNPLFENEYYRAIVYGEFRPYILNTGVYQR